MPPAAGGLRAPRSPCARDVETAGGSPQSPHREHGSRTGASSAQRPESPPLPGPYPLPPEPLPGRHARQRDSKGPAAFGGGSADELSYPKRNKLHQQFLAIVALGSAKPHMTPKKVLASSENADARCSHENYTPIHSHCGTGIRLYPVVISKPSMGRRRTPAARRRHEVRRKPRLAPGRDAARHWRLRLPRRQRVDRFARQLSQTSRKRRDPAGLHAGCRISRPAHAQLREPGIEASARHHAAGDQNRPQRAERDSGPCVLRCLFPHLSRHDALKQRE